jgi:hypothetical protein
MRNAEHFDFFKNIIAFLLTKILKPAALQPLLDRLVQLFEKEDLIYKRDVKHVETKQINEAHEKRRMAFMGLKRSVEATTYSEDANLREAGQTLMEIMDKYADAYYAPMTEVSSLFFNMIQDLAKPRYAAAATVANVSSLIERLDRDNEAFIAAYVERTFNLEELKKIGSMKDIRLLVDEAAFILTDSINVMARANEMQRPVDQEVKALLEEIITFINSFIHQYEIIISRRNPKYHPGKDDDTDLPGEDEEDEDEGDVVPHFTVTAQAVLGTGPISNTAAQMSIALAEADIFATEIFPAAENGILRLYDPSEDGKPYDYPILSLLTGAQDAVTGFIVGIYSSKAGYDKPFAGIGLCDAEIVKDDLILACLDDLQYPATMRND